MMSSYFHLQNTANLRDISLTLLQQVKLCQAFIDRFTYTSPSDTTDSLTRYRYLSM